MPYKLDLETWKRRPHYEFYRRSEDPFFNLCTTIDVTELVERVAGEGGSFFLSSLWTSQRAANDIEPFRYRLDGESVIVFDRVDCGSTILRRDDTFGFAYFRYTPDFNQFASSGAREIAGVRARSGDLVEQPDRLDLIYYSVIPWISFTSFSHARNRGATDSVPRIVFGKHYRAADRRLMPISVEVHHALMDGLHVARYLERFQQYLDDFATITASG